MKPTTQLGLGLAALGRPEYINIRAQWVDKSQAAFERNAFAMLDEAYALGIRFFDTAPSYGKGETYLLAWHNARKHPDVTLSTKWGYTYVANWELGYAGKHEIKEHSLAKLRQQWQQSKQLLPALAYYQIHSATFESKVLTNQAVLNEMSGLREAYGLKLGMTSTGANQHNVLTAAKDICVHQTPLFDSFQATYNIFDQSAYACLTELLATGKKVIIKEALANGRVFPNPNFPSYREHYAQLNALAKKYAVGIDAIALRFIIDHLGPTLVLSGASSTDQLRENLQVYSFSLSQSEIDLLKTFHQNTDEYWSERSSLAWN